MRDLMPTNPDSSPVSRDLREVFHLVAADARPLRRLAHAHAATQLDEATT
jgi:hypothetical protein